MFMDLKEQQRLSQLYSVFYTEVKQYVLNVITEYPDCDNDEIRKKIRANIENYFDKSIGVEKMGVMLSSRGCISDPVIILEEIKTSFIRHYETCRLPLVNSQTTLNKIALIEKEVDKKVKKMLKDEHRRFGRRLGSCHLYWATKKKILREHYGIIWHTPAECNPDVRYD